MRRNLEWVKAHRSACDEVLDNFLVYEFSLRDEVYSEAPVLKTAYIDGFRALFLRWYLTSVSRLTPAIL